MKIFLYFIGKPKDKHANAIAEEFCRRASHFAACEMREIQPSRFAIPLRHPTARKIYLDPVGKELDSPSFAALFSHAEMAGQDLVFLIGAHEGLTDAQRKEADLLVSLGRMTWPHELARAMLAEQIYRAFATLRNLPYIR